MRGDPLGQWSEMHSVKIMSSAADFPPIQVYEGEGEQLNIDDKIGEIVLTLPSHIHSGTRATIQMRQNRSGLVEVKLTIDGKSVPGSLHRNGR